jgi:uncharacterized cupin superfamily protein
VSATANVFDPEYDDSSDRPGFTCRRARVGWQAGMEHLGASLYDVPPGQATFPYHWHAANEELLIVLRGSPSLRTPDGWRELQEGAVVAFPRGEGGAHQIANRGEADVRFLLVSEMNAPEVNVYPDSGKVGARTRAPGSRDDGDAIFASFRLTDQVDYWEDEGTPEEGE